MVKQGLRRALILLLAALLLVESSPLLRTSAERAERLAAPYTYDATRWLLDAGLTKLEAYSLPVDRYLDDETAVGIVTRYRALIGHEEELEGELARAAAAAMDIRAVDESLLQDLEALQVEQGSLQMAVESVLEQQAMLVLQENGFGTAGFVLPPLTFHFSELPLALIVSPRNVIRQDANILLDPALPLDQRIQLETVVEEELGVSALVVGIGGLGYYPTMVMDTTALDWIAEVIIHEWVHNFLDLHPLGMNYNTSPELRTMNETTANLIGRSMGAALMDTFYAPTATMDAVVVETEPAVESVPLFDFRAEMYATRVEADRLLALGEIEEAEAYLEARRLVFVEAGYPLRRLNQAYFAFHGAYADEAGGAAGDDPVGEAVRTLWALSESPAAFLRTMAWMNSYDDLLAELATQHGAHQP